MSIIQEALKKAKDEPPLHEEGKAEPKKRIFSYRKTAMFFYASAVFFLSLYVLALFQPPRPAPARTGIAYPVTPKNTAPGSSAPDVKPPAESAGRAKAAFNIFRMSRFPDYVLSGVMQLVDGPRAIVNNVMVGVGDVVGGATVERINKESVVLRTQDSEIIVGLK